MGRKSGLGKLFVSAAKASLKAADRAAKEAEKERKRQLKEEEREDKRRLKEMSKQAKQKEREAKAKNKQIAKTAKEREKQVKNSLSTETITKFGLGIISDKKTSYTFNNSLSIEKEISQDSSVFENDKKIKLADVDELLLSGRFNSVLGSDGIKYFKNEIKGIIDSVNKNTNKDNFINLDDFFEILLRSGIYYEYNHVPEDMNYLDDDLGWLTAYRFVSKNFRDLSYKEFRTIVKDIQKSDGNTIEFDENEKGAELYGKIEKSGLFSNEVSVSSALSKLDMKELRALCTELETSSKRSKSETIDMLVDDEGFVDKIESKLNVKENDLMFTIKDVDLVKGQDIVHLDKYLRDISKHVRNELFEFVEKKQEYQLVEA